MFLFRPCEADRAREKADRPDASEELRRKMRLAQLEFSKFLADLIKAFFVLCILFQRFIRMYIAFQEDAGAGKKITLHFGKFVNNSQDS